MDHIYIIYLFFLLLVVSILKSEDVKFKYITLSENKLPESRLLINGKKEKTDNKIHKKEKNDNENKLEKKNKKVLKSKNKPVVQKSYKFKVNFKQKEEKPSVEEIKIFYDNLVKLDKNSSITIKGYAKKRDNDSTSKVRRLSLKRALFLRSLLIQENYKISQIYIKALGNDSNLQGNKDVVIISIN